MQTNKEKRELTNIFANFGKRVDDENNENAHENVENEFFGDIVGFFRLGFFKKMDHII